MVNGYCQLVSIGTLDIFIDYSNTAVIAVVVRGDKDVTC